MNGGEALSDDTQRVLGAIEARQDSNDQRLDRIEAKLDRALAELQQAKGGIRMLVAVGSVGGAVGAGLMKVWGALKGGV